MYISLDFSLFVGSLFIKNIFLLKNNFEKYISCFLIKKNDNISVFLKDDVSDFVFFLKNSFYFSYNQLLDFTTIDRLQMSVKKDKRFEFFYLFVNTNSNYRIFLRGFVSSFESIKSLHHFYSSSV
jgi:NADH:ubiquinone oxidoreductase subunit C